MVPAVSWQGRSAGGKGVRDLVLPQAFAVSSRRKKELGVQVLYGFGLCLTVFTRHKKATSKEDTLSCCGLYYL